MAHFGTPTSHGSCPYPSVNLGVACPQPEKRRFNIRTLSRFAPIRCIPLFSGREFLNAFGSAGLAPLAVSFACPVFLAATFGTDRGPVFVASSLVLSECVFGVVPVVF